MDALTFDVAYRFSEYRKFALEHVRAVKGVSPGLFGRILISITAAVVFAIKEMRMPRCSFTIDQTGIRRRTSGGEYVVPWGRVRRVLRCEPGYVIELERGAMPIPYRCLDQNQRTALETLLRTNGKVAFADPDR